MPLVLLIMTTMHFVMSVTDTISRQGVQLVTMWRHYVISSIDGNKFSGANYDTRFGYTRTALERRSVLAKDEDRT